MGKITLKPAAWGDAEAKERFKRAISLLVEMAMAEVDKDEALRDTLQLTDRPGEYSLQGGPKHNYSLAT